MSCCSSPKRRIASQGWRAGLGQIAGLRLGSGQLRLRIGKDLLHLRERGIQRIGAVLFLGQLRLRVGKDLLRLCERGIQRVGAVLLLGQLGLGIRCSASRRRTAGFQIRADGFCVLQQGVELGNFLILAFQSGGHGGDLLFKSAFVAVSSSSWAVSSAFLLVGGILAHESHDGQHNGHKQRNAHVEASGFESGESLFWFQPWRVTSCSFFLHLWFIIAQARQKGKQSLPAESARQSDAASAIAVEKWQETGYNDSGGHEIPPSRRGKEVIHGGPS